MKTLTVKLLLLSLFVSNSLASNGNATSRVRSDAGVVRTDDGEYVENPYEARIRRDRQDLFLDICREELPKYGKEGLCYPYSKRIVGSNFDEILRSINKEFSNLDRRNKQIPRIQVLPRTLKKVFKDTITRDDKYTVYFLEGADAYRQKYAPKPTVQPAVQNNSNQGNSGPTTRGQVRDLGVVDLTVRDMDENQVEEIDFEKRFHDDTPLIVEQLCVRRVVDKEIYTSDQMRKCKSLAKSLKGKSLGDIHKTLNNDELLDIEARMVLLKGLYKTLAKRSGYSDDDLSDYQLFLDKSARIVTIPDPVIVEKPKPKPQPKPEPKPEPAPAPKAEPVVKQVPEVEPVVEKPAKSELEIAPEVKPSGDNPLALSEDEIKKCADDINPAACRARLIMLKQKALEANKPVEEVEQEDEPIKPNLVLSDEEKLKRDERDSALGKIDDQGVLDSIEALNKKYDDLLEKKIKEECGDKPTQECVDKVAYDIFKLKNAELDKIIADYHKSQEPVVIATPIEEVPELPEEIDLTPPKDPVSNDGGRETSSLPKETCDDQIKNKILELLEKDDYNLIGKQFQLTSLKLALQVLEKSTHIDTVETYLKTYQKELLNEDKSQVLDDLVGFYRDHGKVEDTNFVSKNFKQLKNSSYWKQGTRIYNETASVFILADSLSNENSKFNEVDAAATWFAEQVNKNFKIGSYHNNLTNLTSLTYRQLGVLKKERPVKLGNLRRRIGEKSSEIDEHFAQMKNQIALDLAHCFEGEKSACWTEDAFNDKFSKSLMSLTHKLKTDDKFNVEMDRSLKGTLTGGGFKIDFLPRDRDI